ncbi:hypothetical protein [Dolichospermum phage Dfl-JY45]
MNSTTRPAKPEAHLLTFEAWVDAKWDALSNHYRQRYTETFGEAEARFAAASNGGDQRFAVIVYHHRVLTAPREASVPLEVYDSWPEAVAHDAERHFFDLRDRLDERLYAHAQRSTQARNAEATPGF